MSSPRSSVFRAAALERLSSPEQLDERMRVVAPRGWLALATLGLLLAVIVAWSLFGHVAMTIRGHGQFSAGGDRAIILVPADEVRQVRAGMPVQLMPTTYATTEDHVVRGAVSTVAARPASRDELLALLGHEDQAWRQGANTPFVVEVAIEGVPVAGGAPCTARIIVSNQRPITLVLSGGGHPRS